MSLSAQLVAFLLTAVFSFLVGLEIRSYRERHRQVQAQEFFGTARTYTFTGILGYVFYRIDPSSLIPYVAVLLGLTILYLFFYRERLRQGHSSILLYTVLMCVYALGPLSVRFPLWVPSLLFVLIVFLLNANRMIYRLSLGLNPYEFETLGKMVLLSAVILPLLPDEKVIAYLPLSPFKIWLAVVVISAISYIGYLMQRYLFPSRGYFLTGLIGGTYSSTATTVVLARKARTQRSDDPVLQAGIIAATAVMYLRLVVVAFVFNFQVATRLLLPFLLLAATGMAVAWFFLRRGRDGGAAPTFVDKNPLELGTAFAFAVLFVLMIVLTRYVTREFGDEGLRVLSFVVGFTDIDPFVLSLLTGKYGVGFAQIVSAVIIAAGSNNLLKAIYALWFGGRRCMSAAFWVALSGIVTITIGWFSGLHLN